MTDTTPEGKPDAILFREEHKRGASAHERAENTRSRFAAVLGSPREVHVAKVEGQGYLARAVIDHSMLDLDRNPRFRWVEQPDGVQYGYLIGDGGRMSFTAREDAERTERLQKRFDGMVASWRELKGRDPATLSPEDAAQLDVLSRMVAAMAPELANEDKKPS